MTVDELLDLASDIFYEISVFVNTIINRHSHAVRLVVLINNQKETGMAVQVPDDQPFGIHIMAADKFGNTTADSSPITITPSDLTLCSIAADPAHPGDTEWWLGTPLMGSGSFVINANDGKLSGVSDQIDIVPGAPAVLEVQIHAA